ncbi:MAG: carboxymuconolactone decarboxylase family protein [Acidobacteria bacterium]|nr:carboxymuconolactone decarboxylase family protein [Acidobacteriota bacterium]MBI3657069.1 carboxymuconolactone decarboxylase family protein [Acidobacteriota bacterium]
MGRIRTLDTAEVDGTVKAIYEEFLRVRGNIPNMFKTLAHKPAILQTAVAHYKAVMSSGEVEALLKELLSVRVSQINQCDY